MKYVTKAAFTREYCKLDSAKRAKLKAHYLDVYKRAIFAETMMDIEQRFRWMREADDATPANHSA